MEMMTNIKTPITLEALKSRNQLSALIFSNSSPTFRDISLFESSQLEKIRYEVDGILFLLLWHKMAQFS